MRNQQHQYNNNTTPTHNEKSKQKLIKHVYNTEYINTKPIHRIQVQQNQ